MLLDERGDSSLALRMTNEGGAQKEHGADDDKNDKNGQGMTVERQL